MELSKVIASNLRRLRVKNNLTLGQLSKVSGISKAILSDIEKGDGNPTVNTIWKIANGLNVPYTKLIEDTKKEVSLVRKSDLSVQFGETNEYRVYCYFENTPHRNFELVLVEQDSHSSNASIGHTKSGQEYVYVLQGTLKLNLKTTDYILNAGDAFVFDSSVDHAYFNEHDSPLSFLVINFYPNE